MKRTQFLFFVLLFTISTAILLPGISVNAATMTFYNPQSSRTITPRAMSTDGSVIVGESMAYMSTYAFRWTADSGFTEIGYTNYHTSAYGVTADGSTLVGTHGYQVSQASKWSPPYYATTTLGVFDPIPSASATSCANACSWDGSVIVGQCYPPGVGKPAGFRWTEAEGVTFMENNSIANACSADGSLVVGQAGYYAAMWDANGNLTRLGPDSSTAYSSSAIEISPDGRIVAGYVEYWNGAKVACRWTDGGDTVSLGVLPGDRFSSTPTGMTADGSIIIGNWTTGPVFNRRSGNFLWTSSAGIRDIYDALSIDYGLDLTGWTIKSVDCISADGRTIVGTGKSPSGTNGMWVAVVPEPSSISALLIMSCLACSRFKKRKS